ncbi:MAG: hypothetical protein OEV49_15640 [candidate division Zixibacteria bacterium]|nr:hypothetical protein [candidate division Zixibacteria bacterium]MDH3937856.1 hypothetical protein [candidate division Zixibacteria bacterium]MDH4033424.1 hypothetical protein [candidate division Zixibacteria bacterium]
MKIQRSAAILLSRQPLRPCGQDAWVRQTLSAVRWVKANSLVLHSSVGVQTWELITALASVEKLPLILMIPAASKADFFKIKKQTLEQFALDETLVTFRALLAIDERSFDKHKLMQERDQLIALDSDVVVPISIRKGGVMSELVAAAETDGKPIINSWRINHETRVGKLGYTIAPEDLTEEILSCKDRYLVHWTRAANTCWPTERAVDYYRDVVHSQKCPRSGFDTLESIMNSRKIVASSNNMPGNTRCVCFSALRPSELVPLIRWRARYSQMSFEPYGIGIERKTANALGIKPVCYYQSAEGPPSVIEPWLTQSAGSKSDWRQEKEYRHSGDIDFSAIPKDRLACFCRTSAEAEQLSASTGIRTVPFTD